MITSISNARIKMVIQLQKMAKVRSREKLFVAEGLRMCQEVPPEQLEAVYVTEAFWKRNQGQLALPSRKVEFVSEAVFEAMSDTRSPQGILAVIRQKEYNLGQLLDMDTCPVFIALENLQDPGNLGTIIRTAEGAGMTGVIVSRGTVDRYNPKVIRSTMGSLFRVPVVSVDNMAEVMRQLSEKGIHIYAAHLEGSVSYDYPDYRKSSVILVGNEGNGLTKEVVQTAGSRVRIPMEGSVESMNAAISAAILMYEVHRQRHQ